MLRRADERARRIPSYPMHPYAIRAGLSEREQVETPHRYRQGLTAPNRCNLPIEVECAEDH